MSIIRGLLRRYEDYVLDYSTIPLSVFSAFAGFVGCAGLFSGLWGAALPWCIASLVGIGAVVLGDYYRRLERKLLLERLRRAEARLLACDAKWGMAAVNKAIDAYNETHDEPRPAEREERS